MILFQIRILRYDTVKRENRAIYMTNDIYMMMMVKDDDTRVIISAKVVVNELGHD